MAVMGHIRPDGDDVGAVLAVYGYIKKVFSDITVHAFLEKPAEYFSCLRYAEVLDGDFEKGLPSYDVCIVLDCGDKERLGPAAAIMEKAKKTVCIDHHISNLGFADENYVEPEASSTCELVYQTMEEEEIDEDTARALYLGIVHDTGVFQYPCTSRKTMEIAGKLISYGFDFTKLIDETFYEKTYLQNQILGRALLESFRFLNGRCIVSAVDKSTMNFYGVDSNDFEGIVNQLRITKGVECAIFMYQTDLLEYKVSMRSRRIVNVAEIAGYFGGGGHIRAAGCTMKGTFHDVVNNLSLHIEKQLKRYDEEHEQ